MELHGGKMWIESKLGVGTTVFFTLPVEKSRPEQSARRWFGPYLSYDPRMRPSLAQIPQPQPHIVVVEQGHTLSDLMKHYIEGLEVTSVPSIESRQPILQSEAIGALVLNEMSITNVLNTLAKLPTMAFDVPVMSCWTPERKTTFEQMGVQGYLVKPIHRSSLLESINQAAPRAQRILLVEDDREAMQLFRRMLSAADSSIVTSQATEGEAALALMRDWHPDLVLLDLVMSGFDGFKVLARKAEDEAIKDIPVIIISAKDPRRDPIMTHALVVTRRGGLSARDLALSLKGILGALPPRFAAPAQRETLDQLSASG